MATFTVQTLDDQDDGTIDPNDPGLSLREAICLSAANSSEDTITFHGDLDGGPFALTRWAPSDIAPSSSRNAI